MSGARPILSVAVLLLLLGALLVYLNQPQSGRNSEQPGDTELNIIQSRLRETLLDIDPDMEDELRQRSQSLLESMREAGSWPDIDYRDRSRYPWKTVEHLQRVAVLAQSSVVVRASRAADSAPLSRAAEKSLSYWLENDYESDNWWYNQIYVPKLLGYILLSIGSALPENLIEPSLESMGQGRWRGMTGQNLVWVAANEIVRGCLLQDPAVVQEAYTRLYGELKIAEEGEEGIQPDASFHQHGPYLNSGSYGASFAKDTARFLAVSWGTAYQAPDEVVDTFFRFLLEGQNWMWFRGLYDYSTWGRAIVRPREKREPETYFNESLNRSIRSFTESGVPRSADLRSLLERLDRQPEAQPLVGHRHFWRSDYTVHRRPESILTLRMHSKRTLNSEFVNGEGGTTHHLADGALLLYREGDEFHDVFAVWDWRKVPGTTCFQTSEPLDPEEGLGIRGSTDFVGGVSNGRVGVSAMDFEDETLEGKKAWFFFERELVCLGAGISSTGPLPVATSVEQRLLDGPVRIGAGSNVSEVTGAYSGPAEWVFHDEIRYAFPPQQTIRIFAGVREGRWSDIGMGPVDPVTKEVFQVWIDQGSNVREATYEYRIVPPIRSGGAVGAEAGRPPQVLSNRPAMQAVYDSEAGTVQTVFREPGTVRTPEGWEFSVDQPCLFQAVVGSTEVEFSLSNPRNEPLRVGVDTHLSMETSPPQTSEDRRLHFDLPSGQEAGSSLTRTYRRGSLP